MGEIFDDRRLEPRFSTPGTFRLEVGKLGASEGRVVDLSLNGAALERRDSLALRNGERHRITLQFTGMEAFRGEALIVHVESGRIGIEFYDMDPQNFAQLSSLIQSLTQTSPT